MKHYTNEGMTVLESATAPPATGLTTCLRFPMFGIKLEQQKEYGHLFRLTYGLQVHDELTLGEATKMLGEVIMHSGAAEGMLDNRTPEQRRGRLQA